jgi:outer membrane protein OmpA-like peptidoglycan-associated protein
MHSRPLSSLSRILLVTCAVGLGTSSLFGQDSSSATTNTPTPAKPAAATADSQASRWDFFAGYSYLAPHGTVNVPLADGTTMPVKPSSVDVGAIGSASYYFNRYVGGQIEVGAHPDGHNDGFYTYSAGPVFRFPTSEVTPFLHATVGGVRGGGPLHQPYTWGPVITVGGGLDYNLPFWNGHLGLRLFQADYQYMHINFGPQAPPPFGGRANYNNARLSTGLLFRLGSIVPPPPVTYACSVNPSSVFPGDPVTVTGTATNLNPKKTAQYTWSGQGFTVKGDTNTGTIDTGSLAPGNYTVTGHVTEGQKVGQSADCTATFTVKAFEPPTISCSANPSTIKPGDSATITSTAVSPQNRPLTYSYSASAGSISGTGNTATLSSAGAPAGPITVTCNVQDDKGQTASSTTTVNVEAPPPPPAPKTQTLCSISFSRDKRRPARVDNEAKACLDDVTLNLQRQPDATLAIVGEADPSEKGAAKLAPARAVNTKDYLVKEKGIDPSRITVHTGSTPGQTVENYLIPSGATFTNDVPGTTPVDESAVKPQARKPVAHKGHKKAR